MTAGFGYRRPAGLAEALQALDGGGPGARVLAGGTDLMVAVRRGRERPALLVDVTALPELRELREEADGTLRIGAAATHTEVADSPLVLRCAPVLARACAAVGSVAVRNLGTLGGNVA
ncbi:MAG: FAD binding domain-containing protein, partial [Deferrisomatales bacterium]